VISLKKIVSYLAKISQGPQKVFVVFAFARIFGFLRRSASYLLRLLLFLKIYTDLQAFISPHSFGAKYL